MDDISEKQMNFNLDILPAKTKRALDFLSSQSWIRNSGWYLAGGTALALQANHRRSYDLDFFCQKSDIDTTKILLKFADNNNWKTSFEEPNTVYGELFGAKVSFIGYPFFIPELEKLSYGTVSVLQMRDIAVMKIIAISQRSQKRDFYDLYWCAQNVEPLEDLVKRLKKQYPFVAHNYHHILMSLEYFKDAEVDPDPEINFDASWKQIKTYFKKEVSRIMENLMELK
jgi:predicted nucleotidyltransferase component of viral defense system